MSVWEFFCNFAVPFTKSGVLMTENLTHKRVLNYSFKENWKSTACC